VAPVVIERVEVVIPARDEEASIGAALRAVAVAAGALALPVRVHVVLDRCLDDTLGAIWRTDVPVAVEVVMGTSSSVGAARALGVDVATAGHPPTSTWVASTDADSIVPPEWLVTHVALADAGVDAVVGTVDVVDWSPRPASVEGLFRRQYALARDPAPVHGANLGIRLAAYRAAGGFAPLPCGEDEALVSALRRAGRVVACTTAAPVTTSARVDGRALGGFADTLTTWSHDAERTA